MEKKSAARSTTVVAGVVSVLPYPKSLCRYSPQWSCRHPKNLPSQANRSRRSSSQRNYRTSMRRSPRCSNATISGRRGVSHSINAGLVALPTRTQTICGPTAMRDERPAKSSSFVISAASSCLARSQISGSSAERRSKS